jgi:hypothetical protein
MPVPRVQDLLERVSVDDEVAACEYHFAMYSYLSPVS